MVKEVPVELAVGRELAYDTTMVNRKKAGVLLEKGHIISRADVELLKMSGLYRVYIDNGNEGDVFESEIAVNVAKASVDSSVDISQGKQGSTLLFSKFPGIVIVDDLAIKTINMSGIALLITKGNHTAVGAEELVGVVDSLPMHIEREVMNSFLKTISTALKVVPFKRKRVGLVVTGTEVYEGKKNDMYTDVVLKKAERYGWNVVYRKIVPDDSSHIADAVREAGKSGSEAIIVTGGMSVDPTDRTPDAIMSLGAEIVAYGIPIKPTTMSLVAYWDNLPVFGISAGGIYYKELNSLDVVFTLLMADIRLDRGAIALMGNGGLLSNFNPAFKLH